MPSSTFSAGAQGTFVSQPSSSGEVLIVRSDNSGDTTQSVTFFGDVSSSPSSEAETLAGQIEQATTSAFQTLTRVNMSATATGTVSAWRPGTAAIGDIRLDSNPADDVTLTIGLGATTQVYRFKNTMTSANDVQIGGSASTTADNLKRAINDDGVAGTNYGSGTVANAHVTATVSGAVVTITDQIAVNRQLAWVLTQSSTEMTLRQPLGGVTGAKVFDIGSGDTEIFEPVLLSTADLATDTLPGSMAFTSDWVQIDGGKWTVHLESDQNSTQFSACSVELATENTASPTIRVSHSITLTGNPLDMSVNTDTESGSDERCTFIRLKITNDQTTDQALHAVVVWG